MKEMTRTCDECKETLEINESTINDIVYYNKKYYHLDCFVNMCNRKKTNKRYGQKWIDVLSNLNEIKKDSQKFCKDMYYKDLIYNFILANYNITVLPTKIFTKLDGFFTGTYKGMSISMNPEDLYDMWTRKIQYLNKVNAKNKQKGKSISGADRVNYDLSVLLNMYDSYLDWKEKNKRQEQEVEEVVNSFKESAATQTIIANIKNNNNTEDEEDFDELLDEIFN